MTDRQGQGRDAGPIRIWLGLAAIAAWIAALFAVMVGASHVAGLQLDAWRETIPDQVFAGIQGSELHGNTPFMLLLVGGLWFVAKAVERPREWGPVVACLLLAYGLGLLFVGQARYAITRTNLVVQPLAPWRPVARVPLSATAVLESGCTRTYRRTHTVVFRVRYGPSEDDVVNLGSGVGWRNGGRWLEAMRPYGDGRAPPAPDRRRAELDERCLSATSFGLDGEARARLRRLLE